VRLAVDSLRKRALELVQQSHPIADLRIRRPGGLPSATALGCSRRASIARTSARRVVGSIDGDDFAPSACAGCFGD
jgi:hypothetical protein